MMNNAIHTASSNKKDLHDAIKELSTKLHQDESSLVIFFFSLAYVSDTFKNYINQFFPNSICVGCTTAGEIDTDGYAKNSISAISFNKTLFNVTTAYYPNLSNLEYASWTDLTVKTHSQHNSKYRLLDDSKTFGLLLIDGMTKHEEPLTRVISNALSKIPIAGGSAGDELHYENTYLLSNGNLNSDAGILILVSTQLPFTLIKSQHLTSTDQRMVVTEADPSKRIIKEINARPATEEYAKILGLSENQPLTTELLAAHPVIVKIGNEEYVRSIQRANKDKSLTFYCAIDVGIVMRVAKSKDLINSLNETFKAVEEEIGEIQATITFDCILRRIENEQRGISDAVSALFKKHGCIGFNTYGEQINGLHVNQTCTGIALGYIDEHK